MTETQETDMASEMTEHGLEDSGIAAEGPDPSCLGDTEGRVTNKEPDVGSQDVQQLDGPREQGEGMDHGGSERETEAGSSGERPGLEPGEGPPGETPASGAGGGDTEGDGCTTMLETPSSAQAAEGESSLGAEGEVSIPPSLSMKSLSRSITKEDVTCLRSLEVEEVTQSERGRDIGRSQTVPRSFGAQSRRTAAQKFEKMSPPNPASGGAIAKLQRSTSSGTSGANTVKQRLLEWCRGKTRGYEFVDIQNFSSSWNDGMAFCALVHKFFPESFEYSSLNPKNRRHNFALAFSTAEARADCYPLIEVDDMVRMGRRPDAKCVFTYVQSLCQTLRKLEPEAKTPAGGEST